MGAESTANGHARSRDPRVSVIIATSLGAHELTCSLQSLIEQDLAPYKFEIVVARYGPEDGTSSVVEDARRTHPELTITCVTTEGSRAAAKNAGFDRSRGKLVLFVNPGDRLSRGYLSGLLVRRVAATTLMVPLVLDHTGPGPADVLAEPAHTMLAHAGRTLASVEAGAVLCTDAGIAYPRSLFEQVRFDGDLGLAEDALLLARVVTSSAVTFAVPRAHDQVVYHRTCQQVGDQLKLSADQLLDGVDRIRQLDLGPIRQPLVDLSVADLNRYLRAHPEDHRGVVAGLRRRELGGSVDFQILNRGIARDLAVLYTSVPYVDTSANVAARRVADRQVVLDIISNRMSKRLKTDSTSEALWAEFIDERFEVDAHLSETWWPGVTEFCRKGLAAITRQEQLKGPYRSVYSRVMHPTSHFLAAWLTLLRPGLRWLAEFSDPVRFDVKGNERPSSGRHDRVMIADFRSGFLARGFDPPQSMNLYLWLESLAYGFADEIIFTNENQRAFMLETFPDKRLAQRAEEHSRVSHHPSPDPRLYQLVPSSYELPDDVVNIAYFGVFYANRGLTEVWQAVAGMPSGSRSQVLLHIFTSKPDELQAELELAGLTDVVRANSYVNYLEYLNLATRADVLIVRDAKTVGIHGLNPYLPSKLADYAGSGTAIWGIVEAGSVLSHQQLDYRCEIGDVDAAAAILAELVSRFGG